jgi:4-hydroxyphenylpyruvate dioxygenase
MVFTLHPFIKRRKLSMQNDTIELKSLAFIEATEQAATVLKQLGFYQVEPTNNSSLALLTQNDIHVLINDHKDSFSKYYHKYHGDSVCAIACVVDNPQRALDHALSLGATIPKGVGGHLPFPAIHFIGESLLYFVDENWQHQLGIEKRQSTALLNTIDHIAINVNYGEIDSTVKFFQKLFGLTPFSAFDIRGDYTRFHTKALVNLQNGLRIVLNESDDEKSQIAEYLRKHKGPGIQHIAFESADIYQSVSRLRENGIDFMSIPDSYYETIHERIPSHKENLEKLKAQHILIDKDKNDETKILLQIFTKTLLGPAFFEVIERKGNPGFGEGNITALFKSVEQDQIRQGTLQG